MDLISLIVSVLGTFVTIGSAIYAYRQAEKAKNSASEAETMKKSIEREYKKIELGKLLNSTKSTIELTRNLTTPANPAKKVRGLNYENIISVLRKYIDNLKENCHYLPDDKESSTISEYSNIESLITELVVENDQQSKYEIGNKIHNCVGEILRIVKPETDIK
ncbi:hypothetical protein [Aquimarina agarivorans]|uniref:hypothetical protein n=1 Tax=Aquimarina agarivorans TaxID=980584 RepID=UPI000248FD91|nr:hypothetical protein [Aquimarina agarivorans]